MGKLKLFKHNHPLLLLFLKKRSPVISHYNEDETTTVHQQPGLNAAPVQAMSGFQAGTLLKLPCGFRVLPTLTFVYPAPNQQYAARFSKLRRRNFDNEHSMLSPDVHSIGRMSSISFAAVDSDPGPSRPRNRPSLYGIS
jgi:hypothetical protein